MLTIHQLQMEKKKDNMQFTALETIPSLQGKSREIRLLFAETANTALAKGRTLATLPSYVFEDINFTLSAVDQSFTIVSAPDPSYSNS